MNEEKRLAKVAKEERRGLDFCWVARVCPQRVGVRRD